MADDTSLPSVSASPDGITLDALGTGGALEIKDGGVAQRRLSGKVYAALKAAGYPLVFQPAAYTAASLQVLDNTTLTADLVAYSGDLSIPAGKTLTLHPGTKSRLILCITGDLSIAGTIDASAFRGYTTTWTDNSGGGGDAANDGTAGAAQSALSAHANADDLDFLTKKARNILFNGGSMANSSNYASEGGGGSWGAGGTGTGVSIGGNNFHGLAGFGLGLVVGGNLTLTGTIKTNGQIGGSGGGASSGGGGGGAGAFIARVFGNIDTTNGTINANGGRGGSGDSGALPKGGGGGGGYIGLCYGGSLTEVGATYNVAGGLTGASGLAGTATAGAAGLKESFAIDLTSL